MILLLVLNKMNVNSYDLKNIIKELKKLNKYGFKLWLVGGALEGWSTSDIDVCITNAVSNSDVFDFMEKARKLGPLDIFYVKKEVPEVLSGDNKKIFKFAKSYDRGNVNAAQREGKWIDGLFWMEMEFPVLKKQKRIYTKKPLLIHDGR